MNKHICYIVLFVFVMAFTAFAQEEEVTECLKKLDSGDTENVTATLKKLQKKYPASPSVKYLDAIMTHNGKDALAKYIAVYTKYPSSKYADAALFRIYSYYYSLGIYESAQKYMQKLKTSYPSSPYLSIDAIDESFAASDGNKSYTHTVQAGAFLSKDNALSLASDLEDAGYKTEMKSKSLGGTRLYIIYAGRFTNEKDANVVLNKINKLYRLDGRVVPLKK